MNPSDIVLKDVWTAHLAVKKFNTFLDTVAPNLEELEDNLSRLACTDPEDDVDDYVFLIDEVERCLEALESIDSLSTDLCKLVRYGRSKAQSAADDAMLDRHERDEY